MVKAITDTSRLPWVGGGSNRDLRNLVSRARCDVLGSATEEVEFPCDVCGVLDLVHLLKYRHQRRPRLPVVRREPEQHHSADVEPDALWIDGDREGVDDALLPQPGQTCVGGRPRDADRVTQGADRRPGRPPGGRAGGPGRSRRSDDLLVRSAASAASSTTFLNSSPCWRPSGPRRRTQGHPQTNDLAGLGRG